MSEDGIVNDEGKSIADIVRESLDKCFSTKLWYKDGKCSFIFKSECKYAVPYKRNDERLVYLCNYWKS